MRRNCRLTLSMMVILFVVVMGCAAPLQEAPKPEAGEWQRVELQGVSLSMEIPAGWSLQQLDAASFVLSTEKGEEGGGIDFMGYYPDQPMETYLPNHSSVIDSWEVDVPAGRAWLYSLERSFPAASGIPDRWQEVHVLLPMGDRVLGLWLRVPPEGAWREVASVATEILSRTRAR